MRFGSLYSGIEAASVAWLPLGWKCQFVAEFEKFPSAVLAHHYPDVPNLGDVTKVDWEEVRATRPIDCLVFGSPCQSFSVAGKRLGLDDPRGHLALYGLRVLDRLRPGWFVFENVPGLLSSGGGRDFGSFLGTVGELGYQCAWRVLDAQYFGVAQRRARVFVVGYLGDWRRAAAVLFERESLQGNPPPRPETRKDVAPTISAGTRGGGGLGTDFDCDGGLVASAVAPTLSAGGNSTGGDRPPDTTVDTADSLIVMASGQANAEIVRDGEPSLTCLHEAPIVAHAFKASHFTRGKDGAPSELAPPLSADADKGDQDKLVFADVADPIAANQARTYTREGSKNFRMSNVAFGFTAKDHGQDLGEEIAPTLRSGNATEGNANGGVMPAVAFAQNSRSEVRRMGGDGQIAGALAADAGAQQQTYLASSTAVRRLTPRECERLQGFPDDYTRIPGVSNGGWRDVDEGEDLEELRALGMPLRQRGNTWRVKDPDGPRYKALGNSMAVPVMRWIGERIDMVERITREGGK